MSPGPSPNDLTRQQLDELDALLQRMLHLPLPTPAPAAEAPAPLPNDWEAALLGPSAALPHGWRLDPPPAAPQAPAPRPAAEPILAGAATFAQPANAPAPPAPRVFGGLESPAGPAPAWSPPGVAARKPAPAPAPLRGVDAPALPLGVWEAVAVSAPTVAPTPVAEPEPIALVSASAAPTGRGKVPALHWPIFATNWLIEALLGLTGPLGGLLTHPAVKHTLGGAGVLLLGGAGAWAARGLGWVEF